MKGKDAGQGQALLRLPCLLTKAYTELGGQGLSVEEEAHQNKGSQNCGLTTISNHVRNQKQPKPSQKQFLGYSASPAALATVQVPSKF